MERISRELTTLCGSGRHTARPRGGSPAARSRAIPSVAQWHSGCNTAGAMKRPYDIKDRTFLFATEILDFCKPVMPHGAVVRELARQLLRSGTSIGANLE